MANNKYRLTKWAYDGIPIKDGNTEPLTTGKSYYVDNITSNMHIEYSVPVKSEYINAFLLVLSNQARMLARFGITLADDVNYNTYRAKETLFMKEEYFEVDGEQTTTDSLLSTYQTRLMFRGAINPRKSYNEDGSNYDTQGFYDEATETLTGYINNSICLQHFPLITKASSQKAGCIYDHEYNMNATFDANNRYLSYEVTTPNQNNTPLPKLQYKHRNGTTFNNPKDVRYVKQYRNTYKYF